MTGPEPSPNSPPPRTTGGNWRWEPPSPAALEALLPGYTLERLLGRGGMGAVYKGLQTSLERPVAIKILPSGIEREDPTYAERFRNEAKVMARLLHPAVVAVFDFGQTADGQLYFVMEYVDGTDIHGLIAAQGRLPPEHALAITAHVCDALTAAHGLGIVHRDIKPSNVLINQLGQVKVADFGLAKVDEPGQHGLTRTGYALGTPDFVAPEALVLGVAVDGRADLYAVGVMLYQMLTGDLPKGAWKAPSEKVLGLDPRFDSIVIRAMQGEPVDRYQSAAELRRDLDVILTVPLVQADAPATAALPQQAVAGVARKRSVAAKVPSPAQGKSGGRPPLQAGHTAPVKPPGKGGTATTGKKAWVLTVGIGVVILVLAGIYFAITASQEKMTADDSKALPSAFEIAEAPAKEKAPPASAGASTPVPSAGPKSAAPAPTKSAPLPDAFSASEAVTAAASFGAYPAGLKVPIPDWLRKASEEGGRLEFIKTAGTPAEFDPHFDLGETAQFDDFVAVYRTPYSWMAVRKNGDLWGRSWNANFKDYTAFGPYRAASITRAWNPLLVDEAGNLQFLLGGGKPTQSTGVYGLKSALGWNRSTEGFLHILLGSGFEILETRNTLPDAIPPPPDFFRDAIAIGASSSSYFAAKPGQPLRGWDPKTGAPVPIQNPPTDVVEIGGSGTEYALLMADGAVKIMNATTGAWYMNSSKTPTDLGPALRVRNGGTCYLAQRTDGSWSARQSAEDRQTNDKSSLISLIEAYGPALDMETGSIRVPGQDPAGFWAIAIKPKSTAPPAAPAPTTNAAPSPAPAQPTLPPSPQVLTPAASPASPTHSDSAVAADLLAKAKTRGGRLRSVGKSRNGPFQISGPAATFDDFVQVSATQFGWAARRSTGETHAGTWGSAAPEPYLPLGPYETTFLSRAALIQMILADGTSRNVWSDSSQHKDIRLPAADRIIAVMNHVIRFEPDGKQHWLYGSASPEKPDFLAGSPLVTGTYDFFIRHRRGEPVSSWVPKNGTEFTFPEDTRDTVEMDGGQDHVILLDAQGKVQVWREDGKPLEAGYALRTGLPSDLGTFVAVRAGKGMSAAQRADGTWVAWGTDASLAKEIGGLGKALDLDLFHEDAVSFALWIEPSPDAAKLTEAARLPEDVAKRLAEIDAQFQAAYDRDVAPSFHAAVTDLEAKYRAAVQRALDAATGAGNLDESVKLRAEVQRLDAREPLPETDAGDLPESLRKLRATYRDTHGKLEADRAAKAKPYHDRYDQLLDAYQKELTQQQRIDDALKVKARREVARPGGAAPSTSAGPTASASAPTLASAPPPAAPPSLGAAPVDPLDPGHDLSKLPPWLQQAAKKGGKLRIWGSIKGTPIDEKQVLKDLRANDFTKVMTGESGLILGMRENGKGYHLAIDLQDPILNPVESGKIQAIDRTGGVWLADDFSWFNGRRFGNELKSGKNPIILGGGTGVLLIRLASNDWVATGHNWNNPADPSIQATMRAIGEQLKADEASVVATTVGSVCWITKDNRLRYHSINLRPGSSTELPVKTQPKEPIVELFSTSGRFGKWAARGVSGSVYSENTGGFDTPIPDLSPAVAMRYSNTSLAIRAPDGAWRVSSTDKKFTEFIPTVGPAIDLDFYNNSSAETRIVLWIEADSSLKPR